MKVILKQNINKLGKKGEIKKVASGYARNFLIPNKYAVLATSTEMKKIEQEQEKKKEAAKKELANFQNLVSEIDGYELEIPAKTNEEGILFGSITAKEIAEKLQEQGFTIINTDYIKLKTPIKETGEYDISLELPHNLEANIRVIVMEGEE
jgi:large subunit ribosomal protein L9